MINLSEVIETNKMIEQENLDVRYHINAFLNRAVYHPISIPSWRSIDSFRLLNYRKRSPI